MADPTHAPHQALIVAVPETTGSALYGMSDVFSATNRLWQLYVGQGEGRPLIESRIVAPTLEPFSLRNRIPVVPDLSVAEDPAAPIVVVPELWLNPDEDMRGLHPGLLEWLSRRYAAGSAIYSACSGAVLLAAAGLLDGGEATSHWGHGDLFRKRFPDVKFRPAPSLVVCDRAGRLVTAGGGATWHDLAVSIIARYCGREEAVRVAKVFHFKWHGEGQLPFTSLVRRQNHSDAAVRRAEAWLAENFRNSGVVAQVVGLSSIPERSLKRRFKKATASTLIDYAQNLRIEAAKSLLERGELSSDQISNAVGYENSAFFRRLFKRLTSLTPGEYRRMFQPIADAGTLEGMEEAPGKGAGVPR